MKHEPTIAPADLDVADPASERRERILDAAERCFTRAGFHRSTMQDVAREAQMSPGNLYRYFASKDAIVIGLTERDRQEVMRDFASIDPGRDIVGMFAQLARKHFQDEPREKAVLCVEIWAEAARNPAVTAVTEVFDTEIVERLTDLIEHGMRSGALPAGIEARAVARAISTLANGMFVRRALFPDFHARNEVTNIMHIIAGLLNGDVKLAPLTETDN